MAVGEEVTGQGGDFGSGDGFNIALHLFEGIDMVEGEVAFADGLHLVQGQLVVDGHLSHILLFCGMKPAGGQLVVGQLSQFASHQFVELLAGIGINAGIDVEKTGIGKWGVLRLDGVAETVLFANGDIEPRIHGGSADDVVEQGEGDLAFVEHRRGLTAHHDMHLVGVAVDGEVELAVVGTAVALGGAGLEGMVAEIAFTKVHHLLEIGAAYNGDDHAVSGVIVGQEGAEVVAGETLHIPFASQDIVRQRMLAEDVLLEVVVDKFGWAVLIGIDLLEDDLLLLLNLAFGEGGMEDDVGKEFETTLQMDRQGGSIDAGLLLGGEGVELAPYPIDAVQDMVRASVAGALEDAMLDEMGDALLGRAFVARTNIDINSGMGDNGVVLAENDADAVGKCVIVIQGVGVCGV